MEQPEKLCETDKKSDAMEPKQNESKTEAQNSDVCNEINKSGAVEKPEKLCETDEKSDASGPVIPISTFVWAGVGYQPVYVSGCYSDSVWNGFRIQFILGAGTH